MKIIIQILNASYCTNLKNVDHDKVLKVILSYPITFSRKGKLYKDISSAYRRNRKFGVGLLPFIKEKLDKYEEDFEIQDLTNTKLLKIKSTKDVKLFEKTLENYQMNAINILDKGINRGIIQAVTAAGKTTIAAALIDKLNKPNTLFIAPTKEIAKNSAKSFEMDLQTNIGFIGDQVKVIEPITVCLYQSLRNIVNNNPKILKQLIENVSLIIVDEAHIASKAIEDCLSPFINTYYRFGLTATPKQAYNKDVYFQITGQLGPVIHKITEEQAKERVITNVKVLMWNFFGKITEKKYMDIYRKNVLLNNTRCRLLLEMVEYSFHKENRFNCLLLVDEYEQALLIKKLSTKHHVPKPIIIWSGMSTKESDEIKEKLNNGTIEFVIATPKWSVGADIPEIETVIIGSARKSIANLTQKIGRGKRKTKGKEDLLVMDTFDRIGKYDRFFINYSETRKKFYERKGWLKGVLDGEYSTE